MSHTDGHNGQAVDPLDPSSPWMHTGLVGGGHHAAHHRALARGFKVLRIEVPGPTAVIPPEFPFEGDYAFFDIGDAPPIPANAVVLFAQITCEHRSTDPEDATAYSELSFATFLDGEDPNTGSPNISMSANGSPEVADWTPSSGQSSDPQYGYGEQVVYLYGTPADADGEGSEFRNISGWFAYIDP